MILFAAIAIPAPIARDLARVQRGVAGARWRSAEQLHLTLGYFGEVDDDRAEMLDAQLAGQTLTGFEITLAGANHFGRDPVHALWTGVKDGAPELGALHKHCRRAARSAGIIMESRKYMPHVTLAYMKPDAPHARIIAFEQNMAGFKAGPFWVDEFFLYSSHRKTKGSNLYRIEASYPLLG